MVVLYRLPQGSAAGSPLSLSLMMHQGCYGLDCVLAIGGVLSKYVGKVLEVHPKMEKLRDELKTLAEIDQICFYFSQQKVGKSTMTVTFLFCRFWGTCTVIAGH